jgi:hypothetical protein
MITARCFPIDNPAVVLRLTLPFNQNNRSSLDLVEERIEYFLHKKAAAEDAISAALGVPI